MPFLPDIPRPVNDEQGKRQAATSQALLRRVNEAIHFDRGDDVVAFRCECGQMGCNELIGLTPAEYNAVRAYPRRFAIVPTHEIREIETTIERHGHYAVVEAHDPSVAAVAEQTSRRQRASSDPDDRSAAGTSAAIDRAGRPG